MNRCEFLIRNRNYKKEKNIKKMTQKHIKKFFFFDMFYDKNSIKINN